jgi:hypothetical protein
MEPRSRVTLNSLANLAAALHRLRYVFAVMGLVAGIWFAVEIAISPENTARSLLALTLLLWSALALAMGSTLAQPPVPVVASDRWRTRTKKRLLHAGYRIVVLVVLGLGGFTLWLTYRAVMFVAG